MRALLLSLLLTCLSVDFSNPLLPGTVRFDESESILAARAERPPGPVHVAVQAPALPVLGEQPSVSVNRWALPLPAPPMPTRDRPRSRSRPVTASLGSTVDESH